MAMFDFIKKIPLSFSHLPTWFLIIGYPVFWLELYFLKPYSGYTTGLAWLLFFVILFLTIYRQKKVTLSEFGGWNDWFKEQSLFNKSAFVLTAGLCVIILFISGYASFLPPHLPQEYDALNYHITIPRQHLLANSFQHLTWSSADLFLLPLDFSLAPFWLSTVFLNKIPQFVFFIGFLLLFSQLLFKLTKNRTSLFYALSALLGSHGLSIQAGTAMLDLVMVYLFIAAVSSLLEGNWFLGAIELCFFIYSKSFIPIQFVFLFMGILFLWWVFVYLGKFKMLFQMAFKWKRLVGYICIFSVLIAGPFLIKSWYFSGTPLYPLGFGTFQPLSLLGQTNFYHNELDDKAKALCATKDQYGKGRSMKSFLEHFWILSVPEKGVNNRFDYPLGLPFLLILLPFIFLFYEKIRLKKFDFVSWFIILFWLSWWFGSQQSRFLFVPLVLMIIVVFSDKRFLRSTMFFGLIIGLAFTALSVLRAHKGDFFKPSAQILRPIDQHLLQISRTVDRSRPFEISFEDAAYADFMVKVKADSVFILKNDK